MNQLIKKQRKFKFDVTTCFLVGIAHDFDDGSSHLFIGPFVISWMYE